MLRTRQGARRGLTRPGGAAGATAPGRTHSRENPALFDTDRARAAYDDALAINSEETGPLLRLAEVALVEGRLDQAGRLVHDIIGTNARSIESHLIAGYLAWKRRDVPAAAPLYAEALQLAHGEAPEDRGIGEGDRRTGAEIKPGEQLACPTMVELLQVVDINRSSDAAPPSLDEAYRQIDGTLARLRARSG